MMKRISDRITCIFAASAMIAPPAYAVFQGDCDGNVEVTINEVQRCANIYSGTQLLNLCPPCEFDGSTEVEINEVQGVANCYLDNQAVGCRMLPTPVDTPPPTHTPVPPTDTATPQPSDTPTPEATDTPASTFTATQMPPTETPTQGMAVCGNGDVEPGETCDDGNTTNGDSCPDDCVIVACTPDGTMVLTNVNYQSPVGLISITVFVEYPDGTLQIPGTGTDASVGARVTNRSPGLVTFVDFNYALRTAISGATAFPTTRAFSINFDHCQNAPAATTGDFSCTVIEAVNTSFDNVTGVTCSVAFP